MTRFRTITSADWRRALPMARAYRNPASDQIRALFALARQQGRDEGLAMLARLNLTQPSDGTAAQQLSAANDRADRARAGESPAGCSSSK